MSRKSPDLEEALEAGINRSTYYHYRRQGMTHQQVMDGELPACARPPQRAIPGRLFALLLAKIPVAVIPKRRGRKPKPPVVKIIRRVELSVTSLQDSNLRLTRRDLNAREASFA